MRLAGLLHAIVKAGEGRVNGYRYIAFEITPDEIEKEKPRACHHAASILEDILEEHGVPKKEVEEAVRQVSSCAKDVHDILLKYDIWPDWYVPSIDELAAERVLAKALSSIPDAPPDPQVSEEPGYGLPEYSLYWGSDARSWVGRWYWSKGGNEDICWKFIPEEDVCKRMDDLISSLESQAIKRGRQLLFAAWRE